MYHPLLRGYTQHEVSDREAGLRAQIFLTSTLSSVHQILLGHVAEVEACWQGVWRAELIDSGLW